MIKDEKIALILRLKEKDINNNTEQGRREILDFLENKIIFYLNKLIELALFVLSIFIFTVNKRPQNHQLAIEGYLNKIKLISKRFDN